MTDSAFYVTDITILFLSRCIIKNLAHFSINFFISYSRGELRSIHQTAALREHVHKGKYLSRILILYSHHINRKCGRSAVIRQIYQSDRI